MELLLFIPVLQWIIYSAMIISAWRAYATGHPNWAVSARLCAGLSVLCSLFQLTSGQVVPFVLQSAAAWACWDLSRRVRPAVRKAMENEAKLYEPPVIDP